MGSPRSLHPPPDRTIAHGLVHTEEVHLSHVRRALSVQRCHEVIHLRHSAALGAHNRTCTLLTVSDAKPQPGNAVSRNTCELAKARRRDIPVAGLRTPKLEPGHKLVLGAQQQDPTELETAATVVARGRGRRRRASLPWKTRCSHGPSQEPRWALPQGRPPSYGASEWTTPLEWVPLAERAANEG